ncbi:hypothetical protein [Arthrobacter sp. NPDC093139]|uniref:hypothetical protein n=1 Tax=Arthrobacter sp. NPDC093139 TaxID=3363945 RepID=UPI0037FBD1CB
MKQRLADLLGRQPQQPRSSASDRDSDPDWLDMSQGEENVARRAGIASADAANLKEMHDRYYDLALGSLDRSKFAAETIQRASAAIAALYTGVLALVFSVTDNPLPLRGIIAPIFLGVAVVLSSVYLTYLVSPPRIDPGWDVQSAAREKKAYARLNTFIDDTSAIVKRQIELLGCSLAALFVGLAAISLPFLGVPQAFTVAPDGDAARIVTDWPKLDPVAAGLPSELSVELYKQQVAEAAAQRANEQKPGAIPEPIGYFWFLLGTGTVITVAGALLPLRRQIKQKR